MNAIVPLTGALAMLVSPLMNASSVVVSGEVKNPAGIEISEPMSVKSAIERSGGLSANADPKKITIKTSCGDVRVVDITRFDQVAKVKPGDTIVVPKLNPKDYVFLSGGVADPGAKEYAEGLDVLTLVAKAGYPQGAGVDNVQVIRTADNGSVEVLAVNLEAVAAGTAPNVVLQPADKVSVPYARQARSDRELVTIVVIGLLVILLLR